MYDADDNSDKLAVPPGIVLTYHDGAVKNPFWFQKSAWAQEEWLGEGWS